MNLSAPLPGPRGSRSWWDESPATPPNRPPQLRFVLLILAAYAVALGALAVGGGAMLAWWGGS